MAMTKARVVVIVAVAVIALFALWLFSGPYVTGRFGIPGA